MSFFITENELNSALSYIFEDAEKELIIISPYIKLHDRYKSILKTKLDLPKLKIVIVFGKNEKDKSKSLNMEDFDFLKQFPNVEIRYEKRLHAKLYANEKEVIITSMNLYNYSQDTNIELGVISKVSDKNVGGNAIGYFERVINQAELIFEKVPIFNETKFGLSKKYVESEIKTDTSDDFFSEKVFTKPRRKVIGKRDSNKKEQIISNKKVGYCIRTGVEIPFNIEKPLSSVAYKSWSKYSNPDFPEKYCHFSGESSNGATSVNKPILKKNWKKAKERFGL